MKGLTHRPAFITRHVNENGTRSSRSFNGNQEKRYYSSFDAEIYFGDFYIDDVVQVQFSVEQAVMPIVGYASYTLDGVARGSRMVSGQFTINLTSPGYLFELVHTLEEEALARALKQTGQTESMQIGQDATSDNRPLWNAAFDIDLMLGGNAKENTGTQHYVIEDVVLTGLSTGADTSGNGLTETYNFVARNLRAV